MTREELLSRIRRVRLFGFNRWEVYRDADISIETLKPDDLLPTQTYVLRGTVKAIEERIDSSELDLLHLQGAVVFDGVPFPPPIVEDSPEGLIINDGMHRVWIARKRNSTINCVRVRGASHPYYAYPLEKGWDEVQEVDVRPEVKKRYRDPENYKALFRDFNEVFPNVQVQR